MHTLKPENFILSFTNLCTKLLQNNFFNNISIYFKYICQIYNRTSFSKHIPSDTKQKESVSAVQVSAN